MLFRLLFKPAPKFRIGQFVERRSEHHPSCRYMVIRERYFARAKGGSSKQWTYDGVILRVVAGKFGEPDKITAMTKIKGVLEKNIFAVPGVV